VMDDKKKSSLKKLQGHVSTLTKSLVKLVSRENKNYNGRRLFIAECVMLQANAMQI
jgi:hypothetical protein